MPRVTVASYDDQGDTHLGRVNRTNKYSNFFITVSTNYKPTSVADYREKAQQFSDAIMEIFDESEPTNVLRLAGDREGSGDLLSLDGGVLREYSNEATIEVGHNKKGGRIHAHILCQVVHSTYLRVDTDNIKRAVKNSLDWIPEHRSNAAEPWKAVYVNVRMVDEGSRRVLNYIHKDTQRAAPRNRGQDLSDLGRTVAGISQKVGGIRFNE